MKRTCALLLVVLGLLSPGMAAALGLGEISLKSYLNEPLNAEVQLLEIGDLDPSQIRVRLATREDFARAGVERAYFLTSLKFEVVAEGSDGARLVITSPDPVREPYLDFIVEARWPTGRLLREYTLLLDPPVFVGEESGITARAAASGGETRRQPSAPTREPDYAETDYDEPAPREMPQRNYGANALDAPAVGEEYMVVRGDTLWEIAAAATPSGASVQQTMLDILRLNPQAFINDNINQLKAGYVLRLPTSSEITRTFEEAVAEVERQTRRWRSGEAAVDTRLDASEGLDVSGVAGSDSGDGHLQIAGVEEAGDGLGGGDISARMEDLDRAKRENAELSTRLGAMEEQLEMQERLISLKDDQIAALQDALDKAGAEVDMPLDEQEGTIEPLDMSGLEPEPAESDSLADEPASPQPATPQPAAPQPESKPKPKPLPPPPPPPPTLVDMVMENILYVGAGVLVLIVLLVVLLRRRSNRGFDDDGLPFAAATGDEDDFADVSLSDDSLLVDEFDEQEPAQRPDPVSSFGSRDEEAYAAQFESGDALAEADIYIAYGRFPQAVDLLKAAIAVEPANTDYRIKLMEACVEMVESGEFQQQYADLQVIGDENVLQRARALLQAVDGGDTWLEDLPEPSISPEDVEEAARVAAAAAPAAGAELIDEAPDLGLEPAAEFESEPEPAPELEPETAEAFDFDEDLLATIDEEDAGDLEIDLDEEDESPALSADTLEDSLEIELEEPEEEAGLLEDEIDLELSAGSDEEALEGEELPELDLDDFGLESEPEQEEMPASEAATGEQLTGFKDLDLGLTGETTVAPEEISLQDDEGFDLSDLANELEDSGELELDEDDADDYAAAADELVNGSELDGAELDIGDESDEDLASMELDMSSDGDGDDEGLVFAADGDEIATKLDLARAYIDMGDDEGARSILQEVMEGGNDGQQQEARSLLEGIG